MSNDLDQVFWMLFVESGSPPTKKHYSKAEADVEAERLATNTRKRVYILQAIERIEESRAYSKHSIRMFDEG
jgi:hypothetical protein